MSWLKLKTALLGIASVGAMVLAAYVLFQGGPWMWLAAASALLFALAGGALVALILIPGAQGLRALPQGGVGIANSRAIATLLVLLVAAGYLFAIGLALAWVGTVRRPVTASGSLIVLGLIALAGLPTAFAFARGRYRLGGLRLTPELISYRSYAREHTVAWPELVLIRLPKKRLHLRLLHTDGAIDIPTQLLRVRRDDLAEFLAFYRDSPEARTELAGGAAVERFGRISYAQD